jgi:hypothetical protein
MAGYVHILRLSTKTGTHDRVITEYQVNYVAGGVNYGVSWEEAHLIEFLRTKVPLDADETEKIISQLHSTGHAIVGDVDIPGPEASSMGMEMITEEI